MGRRPKNIAERLFEDFTPEQRERITSVMPSKSVERRHMRAAEFMTYNAMYAWASLVRNKVKEGQGPLFYKGGAFWLANANNRSVNQERDAVAKLEEAGWIVLTQKSLAKTNWY